jgi:hypothetical protein
MTWDLGRWLDFFYFLSLAMVLQLHASDYGCLVLVICCDVSHLT